MKPLPLSVHVVSVGEGWTNVHFTLHGGGVWDLSQGSGRYLRDELASKIADVKGVSLVTINDDSLSIEHAEHAQHMVRSLVHASCSQKGIQVA